MAMRKEYRSELSVRIPVATEILRAVCDEFHVTVETIKLKKRWDVLIIPRFIAIYLIRKRVQIPYQRIGSMFWEGFDHTTIINAMKTIEALLSYDDELIAIYNSITNKLNEDESKQFHTVATATTLRKAC